MNNSLNASANFTQPEHERMGNIATPAPLTDPHFWENLSTWSISDLKNIGLQSWDKDDNGTLMLFPAEWYDSIPEGYRITTIFGDEKLFIKGKTSNDKRYGALAYGIVVPTLSEEE